MVQVGKPLWLQYGHNTSARSKLGGVKIQLLYSFFSEQLKSSFSTVFCRYNQFLLNLHKQHYCQLKGSAVAQW